MKTTVIYHSADFDGLFCREIARKFLPDAELIGWDHGDKPIDSSLLHSSKVIVLDLPLDTLFGLKFKDGWICRGDEQIQPIDRWDSSNIIWIDHHKSSLESHPSDIPGYRIDGVAACRLAWQWFQVATETDLKHRADLMPLKQDFIGRSVSEPFAVRLAGEYDIWDKRDPDAELFQHGLRGVPLTDGIWDELLQPKNLPNLVGSILETGEVIQYVKTNENESIIKDIGFDLEWEGLKFLACNAARYNSHLFTAGLTSEHDACFGFKWTGKTWSVSLYHAPGKEHHDLSLIAKKHGGGGHRGACGFQTKSLPFI
jgi:hypothetical protein